MHVTPADSAIHLSHVAKTYRGRVRALRGIAMEVRRGEVFGLLGPNGAGKSTLVKILMTVVRPTRCEGTMLGAPVGLKAALARVGYLPEHCQFPGYLTGAEVLDYFGAMAKVPRRERRRRAGELLELVGMTAWAAKRVRGYSKGMKQRIGVAQALVNDPDLVLLDEPSDGVDPVGRRDIRAILVEMKNRGKTVLLNSHMLGEVEMVCDRVAILVKGEVAQQGTPDELAAGKRYYQIEVEPLPEVERALVPLLPAALEPAEDLTLGRATASGGGAPARRVGWRGSLADGTRLEVERATIRAATTDPQPVQGLIDALRARGVVIRSVQPVRPSLEDLFMQAVIDPETGEAGKPGAETGRGGTGLPTGRRRKGRA